jgi:hypothetical protein
MAIKPVRPGGWGPNFISTPPEPAQIDQRLAAQGLALAGDTVTGTLSVVQDPLHPGTFPILTGSATVTAAGAVMGTGPNGGKLVCSGSVPTYSANRTRRVRFSPLEVTRSAPAFSGTDITAGYPAVIDPVSGGIMSAPGHTTQGFGFLPDCQFGIPITKPHDGATLDSVTVYYFFTGSTSLIVYASGRLTVRKVNTTTGATTTFGPSASFPTALSPANTILSDATLTGINDVIDLTSYVYRVIVQLPAYSTSNNFIWTGVEVNYKTIIDERFTQ